MIFYYLFKHFFLAVPFAELTRSASGVGHLCFFCLHSITCHNIPTVTQALSYLLLMSSLLLAFYFVFVFNKTQMYPSPVSPLGLSQIIKSQISQIYTDHYVNIPPYLRGVGIF